MKITKIALPCLAVLLIGGFACGQMSQVLPGNGLVNLAGSGGSASSFPFNNPNPHKWQWHYDSSGFDAGYPILITEVYVRPIGQVPMNAYDFPSVELLMSTSATDYSIAGSATAPGHNPTFAANFSGDEMVVRAAAPWVRATAATTSDWEPMGMTTPFLYNPTNGDDFIFQITKCATVTTWGQSIYGSSGGAGVNLGNRYGHTTDCMAPMSTFQNNEFVPVIRIDYTPTNGLFASFSGTPTAGTPGLTVQFTDTTFTSDPGGVLTWGWDFGDGNASSAQNPSHTYACPGSYDVTLTVTDATNPQSTITVADFVTVSGYEFSMATSGGGTGDLTIVPVPTALCSFIPGAAGGYTVISFAGAGPFFGMTPDFFTISSILQPASVGNLLHFVVDGTNYPDNGPNVFPAGAFAGLVGQSLSACQVTLDAGASLLHVSDVATVTF